MYDLVAVGDVMLDLLLPSVVAGARQHGTIASRAGGSAVNAARAAAREGRRAAVVGAVGDDAAGDVVELELERYGVEPLLRHVAGAKTGIVVHHGDGVVADRGANALFVPSSVPEARATLVSGYLSEEARSRALSLASGIRAIDLQGVAEDALDADVVLGPAIDLDRYAHGARVACSTHGSEGATAVRGEERARVVPNRRLDGSPIGAGDAFAAGFLLALADGLPLAACLEHAADLVLDACG